MFFVLIRASIYEPTQQHNPYQFGFGSGNTNQVSQFKITINGNELDGLNSANFPEMAYFRLMRFLGMNKHGITNSITPEQFHNGSTIYVADFSTSLDTSGDYLLHSLKSGYVRLQVKFEESTSETMHLLALSEFNSTITVSAGKQGRIIKSNYFT